MRRKGPFTVMLATAQARTITCSITPKTVSCVGNDISRSSCVNSGWRSRQVFVTKTFDDLEVAVHTADHQDLLKNLRRLRQRVELAGMHALGTR